MGLNMKERQKICEELYRRYQRLEKKERGEILDEYTVLLGYNRDYLAHLLSHWGTTVHDTRSGIPVRIVAKPTGKRKRKNATKSTARSRQGRKPKYDEPFTAVLTNIWELFDCKCGKLLAPLIKVMIEFLAREFSLDTELCTLLTKVSPRTIDRMLKPVKDSGRLRGLSLTKPGIMLRNQIPVRVEFNWDERKPGYFELDRVAHCGYSAAGQFCQTLTVTEVGSGWTEEYALLNSAHRWVKERLQKLQTELPFPLKGIDSDNGGEFINHQVKDWCDQNNIAFTRGRPYRKNDNCFVEQKNGDVVRKTVGYERFEGEAMCKALEDVYCALNPLLNYWYPTLRLVAKEKKADGRYKKIYEKEPKTPCQRLLESPEVSEESKAELRRRFACLNPVALKHSLDEARERLLKLARQTADTTIGA